MWRKDFGWTYGKRDNVSDLGNQMSITHIDIKMGGECAIVSAFFPLNSGFSTSRLL